MASRNENVSYDLPTTFSKRAPSLGYGDRSSFIPKSKLFFSKFYLGDTPAPTTYPPKSDFDHGHPHGRAFTFGIAREAYLKVYVKENPPSDKSIPGPGAYQIQPKIGNEAQKFTIKGRTANHRKPQIHNARSGAHERQARARPGRLRPQDHPEPHRQLHDRGHPQLQGPRVQPALAAPLQGEQTRLETGAWRLQPQGRHQ